MKYLKAEVEAVIAALPRAFVPLTSWFCPPTIRRARRAALQSSAFPNLPRRSRRAAFSRTSSSWRERAVAVRSVQEAGDSKR